MRDPDEGVAPDGTIRTGARRDRVPPDFEPVVAAALEEVSGRVDVSLYLYGSVATGVARVGPSDVDLFTVGLDADRAVLIGDRLSREFAGLCRGVALAVVQTGDLQGEGDEAYGNRVFLRHYCVPVHGPDLAGNLPGFPADARAARAFNGDIGRLLARWRTAAGRPDRAVDVLGRAVARKTLLAVSGLVSVHDDTWTTDREGSAHRWAGVRPGLAQALQTLLAWSEGRQAPTPDRLDALLAVGGAVEVISRSFAETIGLWPDRT